MHIEPFRLSLSPLEESSEDLFNPSNEEMEGKASFEDLGMAVFLIGYGAFLAGKTIYQGGKQIFYPLFRTKRRGITQGEDSEADRLYDVRE